MRERERERVVRVVRLVRVVWVVRVVRVVRMVRLRVTLRVRVVRMVRVVRVVKVVRVVRLVSSGAMKIGAKRQQWICRARTVLARLWLERSWGTWSGVHNRVVTIKLIKNLISKLLGGRSLFFWECEYLK